MHHSLWCRCYRIRKYIRFSGSGSSHQNEEAEYTIKKVITMVTTIIVLLLCVWPSVCVMCPNHDVVVFQPWTGTAPYLGSVANYTFYSNPPSPSVSTIFSGYFDCSHLSYRPTIRRVPPHTPYLNHSLLPSSTITNQLPPGHRPHPPTTSLCRSSICSAPRVYMFRLVPRLCYHSLCLPQPDTTITMHNYLIFTQYILYTDIWPMKMDYGVWIYNWNPQYSVWNIFY